MNKLIKSKKERKRVRKLRNLIKGSLQRPRVVLSKSNRYLIAQVIDDYNKHTLIYSDTKNLIKEGPKCRKNKKWAKKLGEMIVDKLKEKAIKKVVFDRNGYPYHGKVKSFCEPLHVVGLLGENKHD